MTESQIEAGRLKLDLCDWLRCANDPALNELLELLVGDDARAVEVLDLPFELGKQ